MTKSIVLICALLAGLLAYKISGKPDTIIEQIAESIIEEETGIEIDISPEE